MFQQQQPPQQPQQRKDNFISGTAENQAKERLSQYVYEYLHQIGAIKTAEMFKNEMLGQHTPNLQIDLPNSGGPGFLYNWWCIFWDLYSAQPDKKDKTEPSQEAKTYHKMMFPAYSVPPDALVNGGIYGPAGFPNPAMGPIGTGVPPQNMPDGMFPNAYYASRAGPQPGSSSNQASPIPGGPRYGQQGARSGAPTPSSVVSGGANFSMGHPPPQMMAINEQQMRLAMAAQRQAQAVAAGRIQQMNNGGRPIRPQFNNAHQYMESPSGTPPFHNPLSHNGTGVMCSTASLISPAGNSANLPGQGIIGGGVQMGQECQEGGPHQQHFMMGGIPVSMQSQFVVNHGEAGGTGTAGVPTSVSMGAGSGAGSGANPEQNAEMTNEVGMEMKQSPAFSSGGGNVNGGTPGSNIGGAHSGSVMTGGPASSAAAGPGSVHSQSGSGGGSVGQQQQSASMTDSSIEFHQSQDAISKIKASLMEDYSSQSHQFPKQ